MAKSLVGKVQNREFAFFWLILGGSIGNILLAIYSPLFWKFFLTPAVLSIIIAIIMVDRKQRPKIWMGLDLLVTAALFLPVLPFIGAAEVNLLVALPGFLIILGCIFGIMNW